MSTKSIKDKKFAEINAQRARDQPLPLSLKFMQIEIYILNMWFAYYRL